jgi:hypothetical protein
MKCQCKYKQGTGISLLAVVSQTAQARNIDVNKEELD